MTFSRRTALRDVPNQLGLAVAAARSRGALLDLTVSNPTTAGLPYDPGGVGRALAAPEAMIYDPAPLGLESARAAIAADYAAHGLAVDRSRIAITASTSEAYAVLFKLLCDPGDQVLVPIPSYPLLAWLAAFEGVDLETYPLEYAGRWHVDLGALRRGVGPRTRAIVIVNPNNPTGSYLGKDELDAIGAIGLPIISDEVFARYPLGRGPAPAIPPDRVESVLRAREGLVFALSGLSKLVGLPQMKLGWIACGGDDTLAAGAIDRLAIVLDAYLSVGAPIQHALPEVLRAGAVTAEAIRSRTRANLAIVERAVPPEVSLLDVEGGWYATLRVPATRTDEEWALGLVEDEGVYVHPGYFFDLVRGAHLIVSLLTPEPELREGIARIARYVARD